MTDWCWYFELVIRQHILVGMCVDAKSLCIEICIFLMYRNMSFQTHMHL